MATLKSETTEVVQTPAKQVQCPKCTRVFTSVLGLDNHLRWKHTGGNVNDKVFEPPLLPVVVFEIVFNVFYVCAT